uniref:Immunoglobulin V-set domain-containing protein n=1 Tax=Pundamilia nyererei TaxID=303518 RepID=A0A3B4H861_9CICH
AELQSLNSFLAFLGDIFDSELFYFVFKIKKIGLDLENVYLFIIKDSKIKSEKNPRKPPDTEVELKGSDNLIIILEYVHLYRDRQEVPDMKMASYFRRTELFMDDMKHGNISLKILNVSEEDNGRYRCFIPKLRSRVKAAVVELVVGEKILKRFHTSAGRSRVSVVVVIFAFISVVAVAAFAPCFSDRVNVRNKQIDTNLLLILCHQIG